MTLDSIKTRMQAYKYNSIPQCVWDTHKNEGMAGFFRGIPVPGVSNNPLSLPQSFPCIPTWICWAKITSGLSVPLFSITLVRTTSFSIYEYSKRFYGTLLHHPLYKTPPPPRNQFRPTYRTTPPYHGFFMLNAGMAFLAGFTSGAFITVMACPFEFTKLATQIELLMRRTRLSSSPDLTGPMEPKGPMQMAREIYHTRGFRGLYSGFNYHFGRISWTWGLGANGSARCGGDWILFLGL